jgi:hypothetical protein
LEKKSFNYSFSFCQFSTVIQVKLTFFGKFSLKSFGETFIWNGLVVADIEGLWSL